MSELDCFWRLVGFVATNMSCFQHVNCWLSDVSSDDMNVMYGSEQHNTDYLRLFGCNSITQSWHLQDQDIPPQESKLVSIV